MRVDMNGIVILPLRLFIHRHSKRTSLPLEHPMACFLIYNINQNVPLTTRAIQSRERKRPKEISEIAWSLSHAQILYVIYDQQFLAIWNLADYQVQPTLIDVFDEFKAPVQRVFCWKDSRQTSIISMLLESGDVLVHQLARPHETNVLLRDLLKTK
ncbi:hypothetical protein M3Y94_00281900 [Aphelenchoides besseyi]|nr:hypothetical protein M3Y94_00281900 [Aphelenchoides besseyi]